MPAKFIYMSFREFTIVQGDPYCEVMVDINWKTGKIEDLYCYSDNRPEIINWETDREYKISYEAGKNPLFIHIKSRARVFKLMMEKSDFIFLLDDSDEQYEEEVEVIQRCMDKYKINVSTEKYT